MPSPSQTFSFPSTSEPVFSVSTSEPAFESLNSQTSQNTKLETQEKIGRDPKGNIMILPPVSRFYVEEHIAVQRETKARTILLQSLPEDHMADFHHLDDARDIWLAIKARFGGNDESKKMRKSMLKQEFSEFKVSESEGLHKGYDRFQKILSQLNQMQAKPDNEDCNMKFLRALLPSWSQVAITLKTKDGLDYLSFDDLYNKLSTLEIDVKGGSSYDSRGTYAPTHSAFISAASTNSKMSYADSQNQSPSITFTTASSSADTSSNVIESVLHSFVAKSDLQQQITYEDFDQIGKLDLEELDIKWLTKEKVLAFKLKELDKSEEPKALLSVDSMLNWSDHEGEDEEKGAAQVYGMIAGDNDDAGDASSDVSDAAAEFALMGLTSQKAWYQSNQLALEERIRILTADLENTTNMLKYTEKLNDQVKLEKLNDQVKLEKLNDQVKLEESKARFDKWKESSKNLDKLINSSMSSRSKFGLGFGETFGSDEVFDPSAPSIFDTTPEDVEGKPLYDRFVKAVGMHAVPSPITGTFMPPSNKPDLDDTQVTYGSKSNNYFETNSVSNDFVSCDNSDKSSDSETTGFASCVSSVKSSSSKTNEHLASASSSVDFKTVSKTADQKPSSTIDDPSFSFKENVKTPRNICNKSGINNRSHCKNNSFGSKTCFVCGSKFHLIKDCDFYEQQLGLYNKPMWHNVANIPSFVPRAAYVPAGSRNPPASVSAGSAFPAGSRNRPASVSAGRPFSAGWRNHAARPMTRPTSHYFQHFRRPGCYNQLYMDEGRWGTADNPHKNKDLGIVDSGCSRSMTGNKEKLDDFVKIIGGTVTFGGGDGKITGKGTIRTSKLNFENVYYVEELQNFNLFSVSQICDKKNKVLFTDTECLVLTKEFQLPENSQVVLRVPRRHNLYSFNLTEIQPERDITCLLAKASSDESTKWHRRMAHVNFKNINKLAKHGLVNGLPSKLFTNDHNCVACNKGKQHKASYKAITAVSTISEPLQLLHMDLFGPTSIRSIDHKYYSLVVTDDLSRFSWVFFLGTKDETYYILKDFITFIENQLNKKVKAIRKNRTLIEAARTMLADSKLPTMFWTEAVSTACYVLNRVLVTRPHNKTPYELLSGKVPNISHLKPFGCHVTILNTSDHLGKFEGKADEGFIVGYAAHSKAYRVYNLSSKKIEETLNLRYLEDKPNVQGLGQEWYFDLDYLTDSLGYTHFKTNQPAGTQDPHIHAGTQDDSDSECDEQVIVVPSFPSNRFSGPKVHEASEMVESNSDYAEELARLQRQEHEAKDTAKKYGFGFSKDTKELLRQADMVPAGSIDPAASISAGRIDPAGSISAGFAEPFPTVIEHVHADETSLPPDILITSGPCKFHVLISEHAPSIVVDSVLTKRVETILLTFTDTCEIYFMFRQECAQDLFINDLLEVGSYARRRLHQLINQKSMVACPLSMEQFANGQKLVSMNKRDARVVEFKLLGYSLHLIIYGILWYITAIVVKALYGLHQAPRPGYKQGQQKPEGSLSAMTRCHRTGLRNLTMEECDGPAPTPFEAFNSQNQDEHWSACSDTPASEEGLPAILATIDRTPYTITESLVRSQLQLDDDGGVTKSGMVNNINNHKKFLMFPRFLQMILEIKSLEYPTISCFKPDKQMFANLRLIFMVDHNATFGLLCFPWINATMQKLVKVKLLEDKLKGRKRKFVMTDSDKEEDVEQDVDPLIIGWLRQISSILANGLLVVLMFLLVLLLVLLLILPTRRARMSWKGERDASERKRQKDVLNSANTIKILIGLTRNGSFIRVLSDDLHTLILMSDPPIFWPAFAAWEVVPTRLGDVNALYFMDKSSKYFTHLKEILHLVDRKDLFKLYGMVVQYYEEHPLAGSGVFVLEYNFWKILYMLQTLTYPLSAQLMKKMLKHKLEVEIDGIGNDMTYVEQLIQFIKN
ncbi:putative ribonuclease H-like domain-containing protein [Tanacetum coccineum]